MAVGSKRPLQVDYVPPVGYYNYFASRQSAARARVPRGAAPADGRVAIARCDSRVAAKPARVRAEPTERAGTRSGGGRQHGATAADAVRAAYAGREWRHGGGGCDLINNLD